MTLSVEKERQKIEVTIPVKGHIIRSEQVSDDMYVSIDLVEEVIERQLRKYKNKLIARQQEGGRTPNQNSSRQSRILLTTMRLRLFVQNVLESSLCSQKTHVFRWNFLDITSSYSAMLRQMK